MGGRYALERDGGFFWLDGDLFGDYQAPAMLIEDVALKFLAPVQPSKIMAIGLNYKDHAAEMNKKLPAEPLVFIKPGRSVIGPDEPIRIPAWAGRIDHEAEMAVVIGKRASQRQAGDALDYVLGITCLNDVTARELQTKDVQYTRAKGSIRLRRLARASRSASTRPTSRSKAGSMARSGNPRTPTSSFFRCPNWSSSSRVSARSSLATSSPPARRPASVH